MEPAQERSAGTETARRSRRAQLGSVVAVVLSLVAVLLNLYQTRLMQAQARAGVWPYLDVGYAFDQKNDAATFTFKVENNGVGPALVKSVRLTLDGKPVRRWPDLVSLLVENGTLKGNAGMEGLRGAVIPPSTNRETTIHAFEVRDAALAKVFFAATKRFGLSICYCSVYGDCWLARWLEPEVEAVERCRPGGDAELELATELTVQ